MRLILASASPRRADLLRAAGYSFETIVTDIDESPRAGETPAAYVRRLAMEKSAAAGPPEGGHYRDSVILAADTAVVVDGEILGKPRDDADAERMLRRLSGRFHEVMTGISLRGHERELGGVVRTTVEFTALSDAEILWYLMSGEGRDKAGAYAIQGLAARFIPRIDGSYSNVVGLPIAAVDELLRRLASGSPGAIL